MKKTESVTYCDAKGQEHEALVFAVNPLNDGYISLVYVDESRPEHDNLVKVHDVRHMDEIKEPNPELPTYHLNCWKKFFEDSRPLPADHPAYDHPHLPTSDADKKPIPRSRPEYEADLAAHQVKMQRASSQADGYEPSSEGEPEPPDTGAGLPSAADLDAVAAEQQAAEATGGSPSDAPPAESGPSTPPTPEPDVTTQLDAAGLPPEPEPPATDQAQSSD